jgi:hypothetical protein
MNKSKAKPWYAPFKSEDEYNEDRRKRLKAAIEQAKITPYKTCIAEKQDDKGEIVLLRIESLCINDLDKEGACYMVAYENNAIAIAVCSGRVENPYAKSGWQDGEINYCDL